MEQCVSCLNANTEVESDAVYADELNQALDDCIGINGTNAVVQSLGSSTTQLPSSTLTGPITEIATTGTATETASSETENSKATVTVTSSSSRQLSGGAIGGIVGGVVGAGILILAAISISCIRSRTSNTPPYTRSEFVVNEGKGFETVGTPNDSMPGSDLEVARERPVRYPDNIESTEGRAAVNTEITGGRLAGGYSD
jgi:hypothetical protein